jgi:ATP phosphoribosyltransferase regulatory subunit
LSPEDLPVRVFYNDQIVRAEDRLDISHNEYSQSGLELVGLSGAEAEAEVLLLAVETMAALEQREAVLHIGSHRVVDAAARSAGVTEAALPQFLSHVRRRDFDALEQPELSKILSFIGSPQEFESLRTRQARMPEMVATALEELSLLTTLLLPLLPRPWRDRVRIDLSELGHNSYYSGIAFSMFTPQTNSAVLRGGRYDQLLRAFGFDAPSVGFSLFPRKLPSNVLSQTYQTARSAPGATLEERVNALRSADPTTARMHL